MPQNRVFRFGVFEANEAARELRKHGLRIKLHSQPFQVLVMLLENPAEVVTREQMRQRLWGENTFVDFDHGLNTAVNKLREALDDSASEPRYIETVPGKGYRFIGPVTPGSAVPETVGVPDATAEPVTPAAAQNNPDPMPRQTGTALEMPLGGLLTEAHELPTASRTLVRTLLVLAQAAYLGFYLGALGNLQEIRDIFSDAALLPPSALMAILISTALIMIPVRLFLVTAVAFDFRDLPRKFARLFPLLLLLDLLWALSPLLLIHHVPLGLTLAMSATLVYLPFAQRSLVLMYAQKR